jgi:hypothetical protein
MLAEPAVMTRVVEEEAARLLVQRASGLGDLLSGMGPGWKTREQVVAPGGFGGPARLLEVSFAGMALAA